MPTREIPSVVILDREKACFKVAVDTDELRGPSPRKCAICPLRRNGPEVSDVGGWAGYAGSDPTMRQFPRRDAPPRDRVPFPWLGLPGVTPWPGTIS